MTRSAGARPRFTIVTAVYNVARYLDAFIASVDGQDFPADQVEIIAVDDGSTDDSRWKLDDWAARRPQVRVLHKPNGGQASARNLGLEHARGEWVTFPDPDDVLAGHYLREVDSFLRAEPAAAMVATRRLMLDDESGEVTDTHPLRKQFSATNRLRHLDEFPTHFHGSAPAAFFQTDRLRDLGVRFSDLVRPNFEDGDFCCRYLLSLARPAIGFVSSARYHYRKRSDSSSTLQNSVRDPDRYTKVPRYGYLALLRLSTAHGGPAPEWLQTYVLYELSWYFTSQDGHAGVGSAAEGDVAVDFHDLLAEITGYLEPAVIHDFAVRWTRPSFRFIVEHAYRDEPWRQPYGWLDRVDKPQRLVRLRYHFTGPPPVEAITSGGLPVQPVAAKTRPLHYHGRDLMWERILWLPSRRPLRVRLDDEPLDLTTRLPGRTSYTAGLARLRETAAPQPKEKQTLRDRLVLWLAARRPVRRVFADAWVLMDRIHDADDSGERLFRYLRKRRRKINAWFVLERGTADYRRLQREGYRRVVPHGSLLWKLLMLNAQHLISSHADVPIIRPPEIVRLARPGWRFTFLQHGVIKDDLSGWLNPKAIDLFVVSTPQEYASITGDDSPYVFTSKEVIRTGLPRFDRLRQIGRRITEDQRDLILLTPTWRHWLLPPLAKGSQRRVAYEDFEESEFARQWLALLRSPELAALAAEQHLKIGFLPHPNLQQAMAGMTLPQGVESLSYAGNDVQEYFARAAVLITDYSSIAFNAAYIDRPVVYFQFDADRLAGGDHVGRPGYFDYRRDGFGPVTRTLSEAVDAITETVRSGRRPPEPYARRIAQTFPDRDGLCCSRVTNAIVASTRKRRPIRTDAPGPRRAIAAATRTSVAEWSAAESATNHPAR